MLAWERAHTMRGDVPGHTDVTANMPSLQGHEGVTVDSPPDAREIRREPPTPEIAITPVTPPKDPSRLGVVLALVGTGLLMQGAADALARSGQKSLALPLFLCALSLLFASCAWRLTSAHAARRERILVSLALGLGLLASYVMHQPLQLDSFDELIHVGTLVQLLDSHALFPTNSILPVSPYYPGLELATAATRWLTGLPLVVDELIVLAAVRVVLVLVVFLVVERACHSSRAGGIGVLVYAASPQFYSFDAQYAYETIALAFAVAVVYLLFVSIDADRPRMGGPFALALGCVVAVVISHHVTTWFTVGFLVAWAAGLYLTSHPFRHVTLRPTLDLSAAPSGGVSAEPTLVSEDQPATPSSWVSGDELIGKRRRTQAGIVGIAAAVGLLFGGAWTAYVSRLLAPYLGPAFSSAATEISQALGSGRGNRVLFHNAAGGGSPPWVIALILAAAIGWCVLLVLSLFSVIFRRSVRGGALRYLPAAIAATFPISLLADVSSASKTVADRATTFIFFGVALVVGAWLARRISRDRRMIERVATIGVGTVIFLGSLIFGFGPVVSLLPGPYVVGADNLSYGSPSFALAHWADTHLPAGSHVAADHDNSDLLIALGGVIPARQINPELLFFDHRLSLYDIYLIRKDDIRYIVVDDRLAQGPPLYGSYIAAGEPTSRLTLAQLNKFDSYPFIKRIYDNGAIQVYDVTGLLPPSARAAPAGPPVGGTGLDVGIFLLAALVAVLWLLRLRRRPGPVHDVEHLVVCGVVGALVIGIFGAFLIRLIHVPPDLVAIVVLLFLLALSLRPMNPHPRYLAVFRRRSTEKLVPSPSVSPAGDPGDLHAKWRTGGDFAAYHHTDAQSLSLKTSTTFSGIPSKVVGEANFYERREIKDILAYIRVLVYPDDEVSARRIVNVPKRGISNWSVARMADWAQVNHVSLSDAIDRAEEAGLNGKALRGTERLSVTLAELRPLVQTVSPAELVQLVADRTGYLAELEAEHTREADGRIENLAELSTQASAFDDVMGFLETVALVADSGEPVPTAVMSSQTIAGQPDTLSSGPPPRKSPHSRSQVLLGCLGLVLFVVGATVATVSSLGDWTPPPELSIATSPVGHSVAAVQLGSAGPIAAQLEIRNGGRTLWRSSLARTTATQSVDLPARLLRGGSRVVLVSGGHTLRRVDGSVRHVRAP